jgi:hypothetical protein
MIANTAMTQHAEMVMADEPNKTLRPEVAEAIEKATEKEAKDRAIAAIPALFIDTWHTLAFAGHVRLTLGEIYGKTDNFRTAIVLDLDDAEALGEQLIRVARRRRRRDLELAAREAEQEPEPEAGES